MATKTPMTHLNGIAIHDHRIDDLIEESGCSTLTDAIENSIDRISDDIILSIVNGSYQSENAEDKN